MIPDASKALSSAFPLQRPQMMAEAARLCAARYIRARDLPGAVPGLLAGQPEAILPRLLEAEQRCEEERLTGDAAYRPARHLQILAALLAEAGPLQEAEKNEGAALTAAPKSRQVNENSCRSGRSIRPACPAQAKASGSDAFRVAI